MSEDLSETDTCREFVMPKLVAVGWDAPRKLEIV
jgi:hypothetical protein